MKAADAARRWATTWQRAWEENDVEAVVALYGTDARFSSGPFREPHLGRDGAREYVTGAFMAESDVRAWFAEPIVDGNRASVSWWASLREDGVDTTLAGTSVLRFDDGGLVVEQWDAWNMLDERRSPPEWSPFGARDS